MHTQYRPAWQRVGWEPLRESETPSDTQDPSQVQHGPQHAFGSASCSCSKTPKRDLLIVLT